MPAFLHQRTSPNTLRYIKQYFLKFQFLVSIHLYECLKNNLSYLRSKWTIRTNTEQTFFDEKEFMGLLLKEHFQIWSGTFLCKLTLVLFIPMAFTVHKSLFRDNMKILLGNGALKMQPVWHCQFDFPDLARRSVKHGEGSLLCRMLCTCLSEQQIFDGSTLC